MNTHYGIQESYNPVDYCFEWTTETDGSKWYEWDRTEAHKQAQADRNARAKELKAEGYTRIKKSSDSNNRITRGGIGSGYPEIDFIVTVYMVEASDWKQPTVKQTQPKDVEFERLAGGSYRVVHNGNVIGTVEKQGNNWFAEKDGVWLDGAKTRKNAVARLIGYNLEGTKRQAEIEAFEQKRATWNLTPDEIKPVSVNHFDEEKGVFKSAGIRAVLHKGSLKIRKIIYNPLIVDVDTVYEIVEADYGLADRLERPVRFEIPNDCDWKAIRIDKDSEPKGIEIKKTGLLTYEVSHNGSYKGIIEKLGDWHAIVGGVTSSGYQTKDRAIAALVHDEIEIPSYYDQSKANRFAVKAWDSERDRYAWITYYTDLDSKAEISREMLDNLEARYEAIQWGRSFDTMLWRASTEASPVIIETDAVFNESNHEIGFVHKIGDYQFMIEIDGSPAVFDEKQEAIDALKGAHEVIVEAPSAETIMEIYTAETYRGFEISGLSDTFDAVSDPDDPKGPIDWLCRDKAQINQICVAIQYYTSTKPKVKPQPTESGLAFRITSEGYRLGPAGDH